MWVTAMFSGFKERYQLGVSLIEMIFVIIILSVALAGIAASISGGTARSSDTLVNIQSIALAQAYLDEIVGKRFDEGNRASGIPPCRGTLAPAAARRCSEEPEVIVTDERLFGADGEDRATYDDVDDYDNLQEGLKYGVPLRDANNEERDGYDNFSVLVEVNYYVSGSSAVTYAPTTPIGQELDDNYDAKLITVTVFFGAETEGLVLSAYKSNF